MAISFFDKIRLKDEQIVEKYTTITLKKYNIAGLDEIMSEIKKLREEGYYAGLINSHMLGKLFDESISLEEQEKIVHITKKYCRILGNQPINLPPFTRVISCQDLQSFYNLLLGIYVNNLGRKLNENELKEVYGNLELFIMKNLDKFDQTTQKSEIAEDYFKKLRKIKWGKGSRSLCLDLGELCLYAGFPRKRTPAKFVIEHYLLAQFLAACNAVNNNRNEIEQKDAIIAYKTYLKLLKTDIPALIDKLEKEQMIKIKIDE